MAIFDQRGQHVTYQYNAAGSIHIGAAQSRAELVGELGKLRSEVDKAATAGALDEGVATDAGYQLDKAIQQAKKPAPEPGALVGHLDAARALVKEAGTVAGLATGLVQAVEKVRELF